ncbi:MAG: hypothetical protein IJP54_04960 [Synergistaceae bacterium]|nr:hypothetical protein [Synergistaceae bacterium]
MISVKVKAGKSQLGSLRNMPKILRIAVLNAHRAAIAELKQLAVSETVQKYYISAGRIRSAMRSTSTGFTVRSAMLSMDKYKLSPTKPRRKYTLIGAVKREGGLKPLGPNAFLYGKHPFKREGRSRLPISLITGPSIAQIVGNDETGELLQERAEKLFNEKLNAALSKMGVIR